MLSIDAYIDDVTLGTGGWARHILVRMRRAVVDFQIRVVQELGLNIADQKTGVIASSRPLTKTAGAMLKVAASQIKDVKNRGADFAGGRPVRGRARVAPEKQG